MAKPVVGLVGAGLIARDHAKSLTLNKRLGALKVFDVDPGRAADLAATYGGAAVGSEQALIDSVDLVWICTPPAYHLATVKAALKAGKAIFCEKPLAHTRADARAIAKAVAARPDIPFFMGHSGRWNEVFQKMGQLVKAGDIGEPTLIWSTRQGYLDAKTAPPWRLDDAVSGGVIVELGVHELDFIRWVGGNWTQVAAQGSSRTLAPGKFLDAVQAVGRLASGASARLDLGWADPRYLWQRGATGTEGSMLLDDSTFTQIQLHYPGKSKPRIVRAKDWRHEPTGENMAFREQAASVLKALTTGAPHPVTVLDGLLALEAAFAIRQSIDTGKTVAVPGSAD